MAKKDKANKSIDEKSKRRRPPSILKDSEVQALARLAESVWRLGARAKRTAESTTWADPVIERLNDDLRELRVEIIDRLGTPYRDGETMEKVHSDAPPEWTGTLVVTEVIAPTIRIAGLIIEHGKVVVGPDKSNDMKEDCRAK